MPEKSKCGANFASRIKQNKRKVLIKNGLASNYLPYRDGVDAAWAAARLPD